MTCSKPDCSKPGRWRVALLLLPPFGPGSAEGEIEGFAVCDEHRDEIPDPRALLTETGWAQICAGFHNAGRAIPSRRRSEARWAEIVNDVSQ